MSLESRDTSAPQVGDHALAGAHHQIEAKVRGDGERHRQGHGDRERLVEQPRLAAAEAGVDYVLDALPQRQHAGRRDCERAERRGHAPAVRGEKARQARERTHARTLPQRSAQAAASPSARSTCTRQS
ncbi:MAG: hypothetical protein ABI423_14640 [Burkholderiales bacterium]